jgi:hypothetical protein
VLPSGRNHPHWGMQCGKYHQGKRKCTHSKPEPANAAVALGVHATYALFCWTIIAPIW